MAIKLVPGLHFWEIEQMKKSTSASPFAFDQNEPLPSRRLDDAAVTQVPKLVVVNHDIAGHRCRYFPVASALQNGVYHVICGLGVV